MNNSESSVMKSYKEFWTRFIDVQGRSTRSDFWHPFWINLLISSILGIISAGLLSSLFAIAVMIPNFTVMVRRLHDTNRTMILAIVSYISSFIAALGASIFIIGVVIAAGSGSGTIIGATVMAGVVGTVVAGLVTLYTLLVLVIAGNKKPNRYGDGGSCQIQIEEAQQTRH
ncbi:DUF805 domain-containing protein [Staphylococcus warneri]|uniref:DUF805 domain-containing protein n=1 Tax=Staphylococcus warneri TaxID=1292 RepID=UPI003261A426